MTVFRSPTGRTTAHANATVRLCSAREALWGAQNRHARVRGTPGEAAALHGVGEATAELATREQWLHWIERGTTIRPAADGEWGVAPVTEPAVDERLAEARTARLRAPRHRPGWLRSVT
jgi:hypothetical protein